MKSKHSRHITEDELDNLLRESFLSLDFETNLKNKEVLSAVGQRTLSKKNRFNFFTSYRLNLVFLIFSLLICLTCFYHYAQGFPIAKVETVQSLKIIKASEIKKVKPTSISKVVIPLKIEASSNTTKKRNQKNKTIKQHKKTASASVLKQKLTADSLSRLEEVSVSRRSKDSLSTVMKTDSLKAVRENQSKTALIAKNKTTKSQKSMRQPTPEIKVRTKKMGTSRLFKKDGTFRMKGGRYGKSKHPYHR
ncbi:hypothetical protein CNR22_21075 [Sphingobacteriaceae bacterium]|nr:hypothetical protein CNR22_21075 [Sphingobacteriaceae bacterium]